MVVHALALARQPKPSSPEPVLRALLTQAGTCSGGCQGHQSGRGSYLKTRVRGHAFASPEPLACMPSSMNSVPLDAGVVTLSIFCISQFTISVTVDVLHC